MTMIWSSTLPPVTMWKKHIMGDYLCRQHHLLMRGSLSVSPVLQALRHFTYASQTLCPSFLIYRVEMMVVLSTLKTKGEY